MVNRMPQVSYDPEAGTLYWYFTELEADSTALQGESDAQVLLDADQQVVGCTLLLDDSVRPEDLALALADPDVAYDPAEFRLTIRLPGADAVTTADLSEPAFLDYDAAERLQGAELVIAPEFGQAHLVRLAPWMIAVEEETFVPPSELPEADWQADDGQAIQDEDAATVRRSGFVALVGRPNVGKSTLLNALLGQKVAIVSPRPQTTRMPVRGILTRDDAQLVFVDTPGIHRPRTRLGSFMVKEATRVLPEVDVICFLVDISQPPGELDARIAAMIQRIRAPRLLVLNKIDRPNPAGAEHLEAYRALGDWDMELAVSALRHQGLETLVEELVRRLPSGSALYPADQVTDQSERMLAAELVREQVLRLTEQEVPHSVAVEVEEWQEREQSLYIRMTISVEKDSQKGIIIGAHGAMLKKIGSVARPGIQRIVGRAVYLDLWVKARPNWRDDPSALRWLGFQSRD